MTRRNLLWISAGLFALTSTAHAQGLAVFDHDFGRERVSSSAALPRDAATIPGSKLRSRPRSKSSYREAIYLPPIREAELRYRPPPRLLQALVWAESRFNPMAVSLAGAAGLAQLMPGTARELGVRNRHDPAQNIDGGTRYLRQMIDPLRVCASRACSLQCWTRCSDEGRRYSK